MENKKNRQIKLIAVIFTAAFVMLMCLMSHYVNRDKSSSYTPPPVETEVPTQVPLATVVLDPGHGGFDHGATGNKTGVGEDVINLSVAKLTQQILTENNISVSLTRNDENALADTKKADMKERRRLMHETGADLTVSIHMNKFKDTAVHGPMVFYTEGDAESKRLAECILRNICKETVMPQRLVNTGDYYVIRDSSIPAVIVECGFLSNGTEEEKLCNPDYQILIARGIAGGIYEFVKESLIKS